MARRKGRAVSETVGIAPVQFPSGTILDFSGPVAPQGWLICDGSAISRTDYAALFAVIGTIYGVGDGSTTFNLPDLRGEFRRGLDNMGTPAGARGKDVDGTGRTVGQGQADAMQGHEHYLFANSGGSVALTAGSTAAKQYLVSGDNAYNTVNGSGTATIGDSSTPISDGTNGTPRTASETRPTNLAFPVIIKV